MSLSPLLNEHMDCWNVSILLSRWTWICICRAAGQPKGILFFCALSSTRPRLSLLCEVSLSQEHWYLGRRQNSRYIYEICAYGSRRVGGHEARQELLLMPPLWAPTDWVLKRSCTCNLKDTFWGSPENDHSPRSGDHFLLLTATYSQGGNWADVDPPGFTLL